MINIFIGYDNDATNLFHTLSSSIISKSSIPVRITPINLNNLKGIFNRPKCNLSSTEFSFARFLVPYLSDYKGFSIFMDNDMIVTRDIKELADLFDPKYSIQVVKHDYRPKKTVKFLGHKQLNYEKKNWSSVIIFNNEKCKILTPTSVEKESGKYLHQFKWLKDDSLIGELPLEWNFLVDEYPKPSKLPALLHYTIGGPYFKKYRNCDFAEEWWKEFEYMNSTIEGKINNEK